MLYIVLGFATALSITLLLMPASIFAAHKLNIVDHPNPQHRGELYRSVKIHRSVIPRLGGLSIILGFFIALNWIDIKIPAIALYSSIGLFLIGLWDDISPVPAVYRLLVQIVVCLLAIVLSGMTIDAVSIFGWNVKLSWPINFLFPLFILVGAINTINMSDGMDGLAGGVSLIAITMFSYMLFLTTGEPWCLGLIAVSLGSILGFLKYNSHPARIFMGDGGSNWLGYITGLLFILSLADLSLISDKPNLKNIPLTSALLCLAVPVFDTFGVVLARISKGKNPLKADQNHFHHFLMNLGFGQKKTVTIIYFIALALSIVGIFPIAYPKYNITWVPNLIIVLVGAFLILSKYPTCLAFFQKLVQTINILEKRKLHGWKVTVLQIWETGHRYAVYAMLLSGALLPTQPTTGLSILSAVLMTAILIAIFFTTQSNDFLKSLLIAMAGAIILSTNNISPISISLNNKVFAVQSFYNFYFIFLAVSTAIYYAVTFNRMHLDISPTDFLLVIIPLVLLVLPDPYQTQYRLGIISGRAFILFLCLRTFVLHHGTTMRRASMLAALSLFYIALKGLANFKFVAG